MMVTINSSSVGADTIPATNAIRRIQNASSSSNVTVGVLFKPYNRIVADAISNSRITYSNGIVSDKYINGQWQNPYMEDVLVGFAIGNNSEVNRNTTFTLSNVDSLSTQTFSSVKFDAGDGLGYRNVSFGSSIHVFTRLPGIKRSN